MDPRMLKYYNRELQHVREMGGEFAKAYPKIAGRLGLETLECGDPYVERLLEGFAFLAARVQLKVDAKFPDFTQHLLEMVYPDYLAPLPSMTVVQFRPDMAEGSLSEGFDIPRNTVLKSLLGHGEQTLCEYRTSQVTTLWPIEIVDAEYIASSAALPQVNLPHLPTAKAGIRIRLRATGGFSFNQISLEKLSVYLQGGDTLSMQLYEQMLSDATAVLVRSVAPRNQWVEVVNKGHIKSHGFDDEQALLPWSPRSFQGYRLLREYFAFPQRFMFIELGGLGASFRRCEDKEIDIFVLLNRSVTNLDNAVNSSQFALYCAPAINLFPKRTDRIHLSTQQNEYHVVPDRTRPLDYEVYKINGITGYGTNADQRQVFYPFYATNSLTRYGEQGAYYTIHRQPRVISSREKRIGTRSSYVGSESYVSLVDAKEAPFSHQLRQLAVETWCTNRDLPLYMPVGKGKTDFTLEVGAPVDSIRCISGPTRPKSSQVEGRTAWQIISHLSLNYLSLTNSDENEGAVSLRDLLMLYGDTSEAPIKQQIDGVRSIETKSITRRLPMAGPVSYARGLEITLTFDENAFEGSGVFLLGAVLEQFFAQYVSINTFTETVIRTDDRGEIIRWPARIGQCPTL